MNRKNFPAEVEGQVLIACRRRCVLCYVLDNDLGWKKGQLAHIDRDPTNMKLENAAYLCATHHDEYDGRPSQTKRFTPAELIAWQAELRSVMESPDWWRLRGPSVHRGKEKKGAKRGVSLDVYERRLPMYHTTTQFVR